VALSKATIQKIMDNCDIVDVVGSYVSLTKKGSSHFGLCPFHPDKNPSMSVSQEKKIFNCFSCGTKGNVITFVSKYENIPAENAALKLAKKYNIKIDVKVDPETQKKERLYQAMDEAANFYHFYLNNSEEGKKALEYLKARGIDEEILKHFHIGLAPSGHNYLHQALNQKDISIIDQIDLGLVKQGNDYYDVFRRRIMFPIKNHFGRTVAFSGRIYDDSNEPKYINSIENPIFIKSEVLYNFHNASSSARQADRFYIFEGFMDVIAGVKAGVYNCVATMGTALTRFHISELANITKNIILCFDGDSAGIAATKRAIPLLTSARIQPQTISLPDNLDPDDYLNKYGKEALAKYLNDNVISTYEFLYQNAKKYLIVEDVASIDQFRQEVFGFLKLAKNPVITDFYLKKLSQDLDISLEALTAAFGQVPTPVVSTEVQPIIPTKPKKGAQIAKVIKALQGIIKFSLIDKENLEKYHNKVNSFFDNNYLSYISFLFKLIEYYNGNDKFNEDDFLQYIGQNQDFIDIYEEVKNNKFIGVKGEEEFNDYIKTIKGCLSDDAKNTLKNQALNSEKNKHVHINEFSNHRRKNIKIIKKEE
jgi:DNA primase